MKNILFRCDASSNMGSGHVIRCRTLARQLVKKGHQALFICRSQSGDLIKLLKDEFDVIGLRDQPLSPALTGGAIFCMVRL